MVIEITVKMIQIRENIYKISWLGFPLKIELSMDIDLSVLKNIKQFPFD